MSAMFTPAASAWRFRNDDGTQATATWKAAQNTQPAAQAVDTIFRLRFRAGDTGGASGSLTPRLRYSQNGSAYAEIDATTPVKFADSANISGNPVTTSQLTGGSGGAFVAGAVREDNAHAAVSIGASGNTESEWVLTFDSTQVANGDTFTFQFYNGTTALSQVTATVVVDEPIPAPTITTIYNNASSQLLEASVVSGATTYEWEIGGVLGQNTASRQLVNRPLTPGTQYSYRVRAVVSGVNGQWSTTHNVTTPVPTLPLLNTAEGGVEDAFVSGSGAGGIVASGGASGHAFDSWSVSAGAGTTYDNERVRPGSTRSFKFWSNTGASAILIWDGSIVAALDQIAFRAYLNLDLIDPSGTRLLHVRNGATTMGGFGLAGVSGRFVLRDTAALLVTSTGRYNPQDNRWIRVEALFNKINGYAEFRLYQRPEAPLDEPDDVISAYFPIASQFTRVDFGSYVIGTRFWADDIGVGSTWLGPTNPPGGSTPIANANADQLALHDDIITLDAAGSTGDSLTYAWRQIDGPTVVLNNPATTNPTFTYDDDRDYRALPR